MPVNVAFGPSAGIGGALSFGTGARKYSDNKAQIEQQSKRQMLSDAMNFTKFLQDTRRPEEDQRRALERMDKQQEQHIARLDHSQKIKQGQIQWQHDFDNRVREQRVEEIKAGREKIENMAQRKVMQGVPQSDINIWRAEQHGLLESRVMGSKPPAAMKPWETIQSGPDGRLYNVVNGQWNDMQGNLEKEKLERKRIEMLELGHVNGQIESIRKQAAALAKEERDHVKEKTKTLNEQFQHLMEGDDWKEGHPKWGEYHTRMGELNTELRDIGERYSERVDFETSAALAPYVKEEGLLGDRARSVMAHQKARTEREERQQRINQALQGTITVRDAMSGGPIEESDTATTQIGLATPVLGKPPISEDAWEEIKRDPGGEFANKVYGKMPWLRGAAIEAARQEERDKKHEARYGSQLFKGTSEQLENVDKAFTAIDVAVGSMDAAQDVLDGRTGRNPKAIMFGVRFGDDAEKILSVAKKVKKLRETQLDGIKRSDGVDNFGPKRSRELKALEEELERRIEALHEEIPYESFNPVTKTRRRDASGDPSPESTIQRGQAPPWWLQSPM